jgi:hypothetical protein
MALQPESDGRFQRPVLEVADGLPHGSGDPVYIYTPAVSNTCAAFGAQLPLDITDPPFS